MRMIILSLFLFQSETYSIGKEIPEAEQHQGETVNDDRPMEQFIFWRDDTILKPYYRITHVKSRWNGMIYDEYTIRKNGNEYIETYNEYDMSTRYFKKFKDVYECIVEDIRQDGDDFNKRLTIQRDYE